MRIPVILTLLSFLFSSSLQSEDLGIFGAEIVAFGWLHVLNVLIDAQKLQVTNFVEKRTITDDDHLAVLISMCNTALLAKKVDLGRIESNQNRVAAFKKALVEKTFPIPTRAMLYYSNGCVFLCRKKLNRVCEERHKEAVKLSLSDSNTRHMMFENSDILGHILSQMHQEWPVLQLVCKQLYTRCHPSVSLKAGKLSETHPKTEAKVFPIVQMLNDEPKKQ
jgi:hypothetical protein